MLNDKKIKRAIDFAEAFGSYIRALAVLANYEKDIYYDISHDAQQGFTWIHKLLKGEEISAWGLDTEGIIERCKKAKGILYERWEKYEQEKRRTKMGLPRQKRQGGDAQGYERREGL